MVSKAMLKVGILGGAAIMEVFGRRRRPTPVPAVVVNVSATTNNDAAAAARINALSNPETAQALQNLQNLLQTQVLTEAEFQAAKDKLLGNDRVSTPAGWYDDGSGRPRWWDGQQWTEHFQAAQDKPGSSSHLWWALSPAYLCGTIAFIPALHAAIKLNRRDLWYWAAGLIASNIIALSLIVVSSPDNPDGPTTPIESVGAVILMVLAVAGTIQAFRTRDEVFAKAHASAAKSLAGTPIELEPAVANSLAARRRREESVALSIKDPSLARDLMIGRPDLSRQYYDGGLVDVNHVPEAVLLSHLGLSQDQARTVIEARDHLGGFASADELCSLANLPPQMLDVIRDRVVTL
jgi:hypothetical protein